MTEKQKKSHSKSKNARPKGQPSIKANAYHPDGYTVDDAARALGLSTARIREFCRDERYPDFGDYFSRVWVIWAPQLDRFRQKHRPDGVHFSRRESADEGADQA